MKIIIITLTISTLLAVFVAFFKTNYSISLSQQLPKNALEIGFLIAFMGWMPAPLDISIWHSLWEVEKQKGAKRKSLSLFDFNTGYITTIILGVAFIGLGALIMFPTGESFSPKGSVFANQLISLYEKSLDNNFVILISIAAFTTMFSTTLTTLDASPRALEKTTSLLFNKPKTYNLWMMVLLAGTLLILLALLSEMGVLIKIATIISFLTAPLFAFANYKLINSKYTPDNTKPSKTLNLLSVFGILLLIGFSIWYLTTL